MLGGLALKKEICKMRMVITTGPLEEGAHHVSEDLYKKIALFILQNTHEVSASVSPNIKPETIEALSEMAGLVIGQSAQHRVQATEAAPWACTSCSHENHPMAIKCYFCDASAPNA